MSLHDDYRAATADAVAFLTAVHHRQPEDAAHIFEATRDQSLFAWVLAELYLGSLSAVAEDTDSTVPSILQAMGYFNAVMP